MSEPEDDRVLLEEIKALEDILATDETSEFSSPKQHNLTHSAHRNHLLSRGFGEVTPYHEVEVSDNKDEATVDVVESALETNRQLLELLSESKRELMTMLERCIENKSIVEEKIKERSKNVKRGKQLITIAGIPYFKDSMKYFPPRNDDSLRKIENGELQVVHLRYTSSWTTRDRNLLWRAIRQEASSYVLETEFHDVNVKPGCSYNSPDNNPKQNFSLPKNFKAMVGPIGAREFDWMKIASMDYDNRHTSEECRVMWRVFLHPDINRYRWSNEEDATLNALSKSFNYQDWDTIAKELGTNRSGYQCFIRYNTNNKLLSLKESTWTKTEMTRLEKCVNRFKIGNYIPWGIVVKYMTGRTKNQIYLRWKYNAAPNLIKGRFTDDENKILLDAVKVYGRNFSKISTHVIKNRSSAQLSDHYLTLTQKERGIRNYWSINDDAKVVKLHKKYGADWSKISTKFPGKTRTQLRHRHRAILRYWEKGVSLYEIPRYNEESIFSAEVPRTAVVANLEKDRVNLATAKYCKELKEVDWALLKYFQVPPPAAKAGRKQKYYKDEELKETTKKLHILGKTLRADIQFNPEEWDESSLTDKEKQLLISLEEYQQTQIEYTRVLQENLQYSRTLGKTNDDQKMHFAPLCTGDCNKNDKIKFNEQIEYVDRKKLNTQLTLDLIFETPKNVIDAIGEDKNDEFQMMTKILKARKIENSKAVRKIYVLAPEICLVRKVNDVTEIPDKRREENIKVSKKINRRVKWITWGSSVSEGIVYRGDGAIDGIEPNYHTLLGLQHIISGDENTINTNVSRDSFSDEAKASMAMFKKRLTLLFKYPIGLSRVLRPEIYVKKVHEFEDENTEEELSDTVSTPPVKRRRTMKAKQTVQK